MEPYVGIAVFELASEGSEHSSFFREDFFLIYADSDEEAHPRMRRRTARPLNGLASKNMRA